MIGVTAAFSLCWAMLYHAIPNSVYAGAKTIPDRASAHT